MPDYIVWPLNEDPLLLYTCKGYPLLDGTLVEAQEPREAALAVRGDSPGGLDRWVTLGPEGITRLDFSVPEGFETLSLEPGPHR